MLNFFARPSAPKRLSELRKMSLFVNLSRREMRIVDGFMHERTYLKHEVIVDAGEEGQALYLVLEGQVSICKPGHEDTPIALLDNGSFFGEMALLDGKPRVAQVRAVENCTLVVLFRGDFLSLMQAHTLIASKIALELARHLGTRLRSTMHTETGLL